MSTSFARPRQGLSVLALFAVLSASATGQFWIVDANNGPGTNFTTITAAVAAAAPGDRIVVRPALYSETVTVNKGVTIVGPYATTYPMTVPPSLFVDALWGGLHVTGIPAGQTCIVSGMKIARPTSLNGFSLAATNSDGVIILDRIMVPNGGVWVANCTDVYIENMLIRHLPATNAPQSGLTVVNSWVQANDLDAAGGDVGGEPDFYGVAGAALEAYGSTIVALARPRLIGGFGGGPWITSPATPAGGPAIRISQAIVAIVDDLGSPSYIVGGQGGHRGSGSALSIPSGNGGNAVEVLGAGLVLNKKPITVVPGMPGPNKAGGPLGASGAASFTSGSGVYAPVADLPAIFRNISATVSGGFWILSHHAAAPGYPVALAVMTEPDLFLYPPSVQFAGGNVFSSIALALGTANGAGFFEIGFGLPFGIPIQLAGTTLVVQTADDVVNTLFLANPTPWILGY